MPYLNNVKINNGAILLMAVSFFLGCFANIIIYVQQFSFMLGRSLIASDELRHVLEDAFSWSAEYYVAMQVSIVIFIVAVLLMLIDIITAYKTNISLK